MEKNSEKEIIIDEKVKVETIEPHKIDDDEINDKMREFMKKEIQKGTEEAIGKYLNANAQTEEIKKETTDEILRNNYKRLF